MTSSILKVPWFIAHHVFQESSEGRAVNLDNISNISENFGKYDFHQEQCVCVCTVNSLW